MLVVASIEGMVLYHLVKWLSYLFYGLSSPSHWCFWDIHFPASWAYEISQCVPASSQGTVVEAEHSLRNLQCSAGGDAVLRVPAHNCSHQASPLSKPHYWMLLLSFRSQHWLASLARYHGGMV
ncbi:unnamed protein product [Urochloa humidicola]